MCDFGLFQIKKIAADYFKRIIIQKSVFPIRLGTRGQRLIIISFGLLASGNVAAQSQNEVQVGVLFDGASNFTAGEPTAATGVAPEPHVAGTDGGPQNLVVRTHDQFAVRVDWNINEDLATAATLTTTLPAFAEWTTDASGGYAGCVTTTFPNPQTAVCVVGDQAEGSNGTIRMTALLNESTDNTLFDVPTILTTGEDPVGVTDSLDQDLTVSAIPIATYRKGAADVAGDPSTGPITSGGEDGILFLYPLSLIDFSQGPNPIIGAGPIGSGQIDFFDHAYRLVPSATLATQQQMDDAGFVGRTPCGPYDGAGAFPITPTASWTCGAATSPNGYPVVPISVTGLVASPAPANNADGTPNVVGSGVNVLTGQIAFWLPAAEVQAEIDDITNDSALSARFENAIAAQDASVAITDQADVLPIGVPDSNGGNVPEQASSSDPGDDPSENTSRTVLGAAPPPTSGPGASIGHHVTFRGGPLQLLETELYTGGSRFGLDYRTIANGGLRGLLPGENVWPGNTNGDFIGDTPRGNTVTINSQVLALSTSTANTWDAPIQGCTAFDTTHYNLVAFGDIPVTQTDGTGPGTVPTVTGGSTISSNTGPLAHVDTGAARTLGSSQGGQQNAVGGYLAGLDYTVEFTDAPLELLPGGNFGVNNDELTCNDDDAGGSGWVDATDTAALAVFNTDGDPATFDGITRARVRITQRFPWATGPDGPQDFYKGFQAYFQAMVKTDLNVQTVNQELFALQSHSFGDLGPNGVPDLVPFIGSTLAINCRPYSPPQWQATGNDLPSTTGYCNNSFIDDGTDPLDDTDLVDWDNNSPTRFSTNAAGLTTFLNSSGAVITIVEANLGLSKTNRDGLADIADNGDIVEFFINTSVVGSNLEALTNVRLSDNLPPNYEFVQFTQLPSTPGATCNPPPTPSGTITCQFSEPNPLVDTGLLAPGLPGGWTDEIRFEVMVVGAIADPDSPTVLTNTARLDSTALGPWDPVAEDFSNPAAITAAPKVRTNSARSFLPLPADESVIVKTVAPLRGMCEVIPAGFAGTLAEWQERCSLINIDENMVFDLIVENEGNTALTRLEFIDVFPHLPDGPGTEETSDTSVNQLGSSRPPTVGDGRTPESAFVGDVLFDSLTATTIPAGSALTVYVTGDAPATVSRDPDLSFTAGVNTWCDGVGGAVISGPGACPATPADVTAVYGEISGGVGLLPGDTASLQLSLGNENSACGDLWTNTFGLRSDEIFLPIRSNDVSVQVACPMSIGSYVWFDEDQDGEQDSSATDVPVAGTLFTLWVEDADPASPTFGTFVIARDVFGITVASQTSVADGLYFFDNLPSGNYKVQATPPAGYQPTPPQTPTNDDDTENDSNIATIITPATPTTSGVFESGEFELVPDSEPVETDAFAGDAADTAAAAGSLEDINGNMTIDFGFFLPEPMIDLTKAAGVPVLNDDGTFDVAYTMLIQNTGNVDLNNITLVDDIEAAFTAAAFTGSDSTVVSGGIIVPPVATVSLDAPGTAIALPIGDATYGGSAATNANLFVAGPSVLGVGDIIQVTFTARLNPEALALSPLTNTAEAGGTDEFGTMVDDPAMAIIELPDPIPLLGLTKAAGVPVINEDGTIDVVYTLQIANEGNVDLMNIGLVDDLFTQFDAQAAGSYTASAATVPATGVTVAPVVSLVTDAPGTLVVLPTGDAAYEGGPTTDGLFTAAPSTLGVGDIVEVVFTVRLNPEAGGVTLTNEADAAGTDPFGTVLVAMAEAEVLAELLPEISLTKAAGTPVLNDDGTIDVPYTITAENTGNVQLTGVTLVDDLLAAFGPVAYTGSDVTVTTDGIVVAPVVTLTEGATGDPANAVGITADPLYSGAAPTSSLITTAADVLGISDQLQVMFTIRLNPEAAALSPLTNTAEVAGTDPAGTLVDDDAEAVIELPELLPEISLTKVAGTPILNNDGTTDVPYTLVAENTGNVDLTNVTLVDDLLAQFGAAAFTASDATVTTDGILVAPAVTVIEGATGTTVSSGITANAVYEGAPVNDGLFAGNPASVFGVSDQVEVAFTVRLNPAAAALSPLTNTADVTGSDPTGAPVTAPAEAVIDLTLLGPSLILSKIVAGPPIDLGGGVYQVTYNFMVENDGNVDITDLQITDDLNAMINNPNPNGGVVSNAQVSYVSGTTLTPSSTFTGLGDNNMLTGTDVYPVGATTELTLSFNFVPDAYFGPFLNTAQVSGLDPAGAATMDNSEESNAPTSGEPGEDIQSPTPFSLSVPATPITLGWIQITDNLNGSAMIEWQTATEVANAGFNLLVLSESGDWLPVNASMIVSQGDSTAVQNYEYLSATVGEKFMLVDVSVTGIEKRHGPFNLNESSGVFAEPKEIEWDSIQQESQQKQEQREQQLRQELQKRLSPLGNVGRFMKSVAVSLFAVLVPEAHAVDLVSFEVKTAGVYQVTHQDLLSAGLDLRGISLDRIGLKEANGLWPLHKEAAGSTFTGASSLLFPGRGLESLYSGVNKYTLVLDEGSLDIGDDATGFPGNEIALAHSYLDQATYAPQNTYSYLSPEDNDSWFADSLNAIRSPANKTVSLEVEGYLAPLSFGGGFGPQVLRQASQNPYLEVSMWGSSALPGNGVSAPDHHVEVGLNNDAVADISFDGLNLHVERSVLVSVEEGANQVTVNVPNDNGYLYDLIRLDHITLAYPRRFDARDNALVFSSDWNKFRVSNLGSSNAKVIRLDESGNAYFMTERGSGDCATDCVYFAGDANAQNSYFVATPSGYSTPEISTAIDSRSLDSSTPVNFLIIAHPDFINTRSQGLEGYASEITGTYGSVEIVDVDAIYAAYSGGVVDAYAIKDFISDAYASRGSRHVLLVGGDIYDYQDYAGSGAKSFIPSIYQPISNNVKAVPSDSSYVLVDDDMAPDLTISRLPVRTTADLDNLIAKRQNYLARNYQNTVLIAADKVDSSNYSFKADAEQLEANHFGSNVVNSVYLDDVSAAVARTQLISAFNQGASFVSYFGHSSTDRWSISSMFSGDDVASLTNSQRPAVVAQWGCWNTFYVSPEYDSMAHRFLLDGPQGAVTVMGASSFTQAAAEKRMAELLSVNLQQGMSIGSAVKLAKRQIAIETPHQIDVLLGWAVLGFDDMPVFN